MRKVIVGLFFIISFNISFAEPDNLSRTKKIVREYYSSRQYQKELAQQYQTAKGLLSKKLQTRRKNDKLSVVFDIDETVLSNYAFMESNDFGWNKKLVEEQLSRDDVPVIDSALSFYQYAIANGVEVIFLTARNESYEDNTKRNLKKMGFTTWNRIIFKPTKIEVSSGEFKLSMRKRLLKDGLAIYLNIGDQDSDLHGGFSEHTIKLPNPFYSVI